MNALPHVRLLLALVCAVTLSCAALARPAPGGALATRLAEGPEIIGIVHWGLNTYTNREWGYGDEDPAMLNPAKFDADQIVGACRAAGIGGLVVVAKHHDGFCLRGEQVDEWEFVADGKAILRGRSIGVKRIRVLETPYAAKSCEVKVLKDGGNLQGVSFELYRADTELVGLVLSATTESGETDTARWMTSQR